MNSASARLSESRSQQRGNQSRNTPFQKALLLCGLGASLLYLIMNVIVPLRFEGYSVVSQTVSELSAIDAPTRLLWLVLGTGYTLLFVLFGWGIWWSAAGNRALRVVGGLFIFCGLFGIFWPPMHLRGETPTLTDNLHIVWTMVWGLSTMLSMGIAALSFGRRFRWFSFLSIALLLTFGAMTSLEAPNIPRNLPTPTIGVWERLNIGVFLVWLAVLSIALLRIQDASKKDVKGNDPH